VERKDKDTLERLRAERKAKIDELKDRTNYYLTQELIQVSSGQYLFTRTLMCMYVTFHFRCVPTNSNVDVHPLSRFNCRPGTVILLTGNAFLATVKAGRREYLTFHFCFVPCRLSQLKTNLQF